MSLFGQKLSTSMWLNIIVLVGLAIGFSLAVILDLILQPATVDRIKKGKTVDLLGIIHLKGPKKFTSLRPIAPNN